MEFKHENPTARFVVPDRPTVRQQLEYYSMAAGATESEFIVRLWRAAQALITEWECEKLPLFKADLDSVSAPSQTTVIIWAAMAVRNFMNGLEDLPKNS